MEHCPRVDFRRIALAAGGAAAIVLLGIVILVTTGKGTVKLEFADAEAARQCTVSIDGDAIRLENLGEPIKLWSGEHTLRIMHGELEIEARNFTVMRGGNQVVHISNAPAADAKTPTPVVKVSQKARLPMGPEGSPIRWFGFETYGPANVPIEVAPYTNIVFVRGWLNGKWSVEEDESILQAARTAGLTVILAFHSKERHRIEELIAPVLRKNRDVIAAVCWEEPYYANYRPSDVSEFGQWFRREFPRCEYWVSFVPGRAPTWPVPDDVHTIVVNHYGSSTPEAVRSKADEILPNWIDKAKRRPVVLRWVPNSSNTGQPDSSLKCEPGTVRMFAQVAKDYGLAGVILSRYGDFWKPSYIGIDKSPEVLAETKEVAQELGFTRAAARPDETKGGAHAASESLADRAHKHANDGYYDKALAEISAAIALSPDDAHLWHRRANVELSDGQLGAYRGHCVEMLQHFGPMQNIAHAACYHVCRACTLSPDAVADWPALLALADKGLVERPDDPEYLLARGAVLYRAGGWEEALEPLMESHRVYQSRTRPNPFTRMALAETCTCLAMAHHRLGRPKEARNWFDAMAQQADLVMEARRAGKVSFYYNIPLPMRLLRVEAAELLGIVEKPTTAEEQQPRKLN